LVDGDCCSPACQLEPATTDCRADAGQCDVPENCTRSAPNCPADAPEPNGTGCDDSDVCTQNDQCQNGVCLGGSVCGNGILEPACGEECEDDADCGAGEACNNSCLCATPIGDHKCVVDPISSTVTIVTQALPLPPFSASGAIDVSCGFEDSNTGKSPCECFLQFLDPINIIGIGFICFTPGDPNKPCAAGEIECDGGNPLDVSMDSDHNIGACASNAECVTQCSAHCAGKPEHGALCQCDCADVGGAPSGVGALQCNLGANIDVEIGSPCGDGDILIAVGTRCIPLTTETVASQMHNANSTPGKDFPVTAFTANGLGISCSTLATSATTGLQVVGSVNFFDSTIGDIQARIDFTCL
jgi:hypothetical protein